ncbi:MAG: branched-chain amino acid ABC transporter permease [Chloroflexi bacterium]|nr:MAG: branched-chain amino acid ABC transporter permease [Chloroflexota bacterium]
MGYIEALLILGGINVIAALGVSILTGYTGLFTIGHAGFMALGGYMSAILVKEFGVPLVVALLAGGTFAGLCSLIIGYPSFRSQLRGDYFAIATLGFSEAVRLVLNNTKAIGAIKTGGAFGYMGVPSLTTLPVVIIAVILALFFAHMFVTSQYGKNCIAIGQDEVAAQMMGVNLLKTKLIALFVSAFFAGVAGGLMGFYFAYQTPSFYNIAKSSDLLAAVVFGGIQSLIGPFITALILIAVPQLLLVLSDYRLVLYGFLFVVVMIFRPQGLLGYVEMNFNFVGVWWNKLTRKKTAGEGQGGK